MITQKYLKSLLHYNPKNGIFTWIKFIHHTSKVKPGDIAGTITEGYIRISINRRLYRAHILAWLYMTGKYPDFEIDHRDLDGTNNRWKNLRKANRTLNNVNKRNYTNNKSGYKGVSWNENTGKWRAVVYDKKQIHLGLFKSKKKAYLACRKWRIQKYGEFARELF